jgi:hypothetical protein
MREGVGLVLCGTERNCSALLARQHNNTAARATVCVRSDGSSVSAVRLRALAQASAQARALELLRLRRLLLLLPLQRLRQELLLTASQLPAP